VLVLTKPLGTGIVTTAAKQDKDTLSAIGEAIRAMATLNRAAAEAMLAVRVHAATDVTGFGLLGHLRNVALASGCASRIFLEALPVMSAAWTYVRDGIAPGGTHANWRFLNEWVSYGNDVDKPSQLVVCDAQTSGGLLIAVAKEDASTLVRELEARGASCAAIVGRLEEGTPGRATVALRE
jgi:selenide,water dikinase